MFATAAAKLRPKNVFYGWWVIASALVTSTLSTGLLFYGFGAFFMPLAEEFKVSRTAITGALSFARLEGGMLGPVVGYAIDRVGPKIVAIIGVLFLGIGFLLLTGVHSLLVFYLVFVLLISVGDSVGLGAPYSTAAANWFVKNRSLALAIVFSGVGIGATFVPLIAWSIDHYGWRPTAAFSGVASLAIGIPCAFVLRHRPEDQGLLPDGEKVSRTVATPPSAVSPPTDAASAESVDFTAWEALGTSSFWLITLSITCRSAINNIFAVHLIPLLQDKGYSPSLAAAVISVMGVSGLFGRIIIGWLGDRVNKRYLLAGLMVGVFGSLGLLLAASNIGMAFAFAVVTGPVMGAYGAVLLALRGDYFGRKYFATIGGFQAGVMMLGQIGGPLMAAAIFDATGSYQYAIYVSLALALLSALLVLLARPPKRRLRLPTSR